MKVKNKQDSKIFFHAIDFKQKKSRGCKAFFRYLATEFLHLRIMPLKTIKCTSSLRCKKAFHLPLKDYVLNH